MTRILLIQGHPHPAGDRHGHSLERAYVEGATQGGHQVRVLSIASLDLSGLRDQADLNREQLLPVLQSAHEHILWAEHIVLFSPLWLGSAPLMLKHALEELARTSVTPNEAAGERTARVVLSTSMPGMIYRLLFRARSLKVLQNQILSFVGMQQVQETLIDRTGAPSRRWTKRLRDMGRLAA
jgi:putative NADPH-quinone reductase